MSDDNTPNEELRALADEMDRYGDPKVDRFAARLRQVITDE